MQISVEKYKALQATGKVFFAFDGTPVDPVPGQWFCEFELYVPEDDEFPEYVQDESLVRFEEFQEIVYADGNPLLCALVYDEVADDCRAPRTSVLILQS